jgi:hypothetical protein
MIGHDDPTPRSPAQYSADEMALYAAYRDQRATVRPTACIGSAECWVELGPPGTGRYGRCGVCGGNALRLLRQTTSGRPPGRWRGSSARGDLVRHRVCAV